MPFDIDAQLQLSGLEFQCWGADCGVSSARFSGFYTKVVMMKRNQSGFTLIELVMVIVILGILAAVAIPKFVDLKSDANTAALNGVVGGIASASAVNYAARSANSLKGFATQGVSCTAAATGILQGGIPSGYTLGAAPATLAAGDNSCTVTQTSTAATATVNIIGIL